MDQEKFEDFLKNTFTPAQLQARERAWKNQRNYNVVVWAITLLSLTSALAIGIEAFFDILPLKLLAAVASILVTTLTGILKSRDYQEKANRYHRLLHDLETEWDFYQAKIEQYETTDDPERIFVARVRLRLKEAVSSIPNMTIPAYGEKGHDQ